MSMGYIHRKKLNARKQRKLRKKYNNFSCSSCAKNCGIPTPPIGGIIIYRENCTNWKRKYNC